MIFVTNRTEDDVLLGRDLGEYTLNDLNRVESNTKKLSEMATEIDVHIFPVAKTDWSESDMWMDNSNANRYLKNIVELSTAVGCRPFVPTSLQNLNYISANDIEKTLENVYNRIINTIDAFLYSGEIYSGED